LFAKQFISDFFYLSESVFEASGKKVLMQHFKC